MTTNEKINSKREMIKKLEEKIKKEQERVKKLKEEVEKLSLMDIQAFAKDANMPITEVRSLLEELLKEKNEQQAEAQFTEN